MVHDGKTLYPILHFDQRTVLKRHDRPATQTYQMMVMLRSAGQPVLLRLIGKIQGLHDTQLLQQGYGAIDGIWTDMRALSLHLCQDILDRQTRFWMTEEHVYNESAWAREFIACSLESLCDLLSVYQRSLPPSL